MDVPKLESRLTRAKLRLGLVKDTVSDFIADKPAPVAFISVDLDYYSSTVDALRLLDAPEALLLPRVHCYFDDIMGLNCGDCNGERLMFFMAHLMHHSRYADFDGLAPLYDLSLQEESPRTGVVPLAAPGRASELQRTLRNA